MNKKYLHHIWTRIRPFRSVYFLAAFLISLFAFGLAMRANYVGLDKLLDAVYAADKEDGDVEGALQNLRQYVYTHMNANVQRRGDTVYPPIQLQYTYQRLQQQAQEQLQETNSKLYTEAQQQCEAAHPQGFSGRYRVSCIEEYVTAHGGTLPTIPDALYKFDFVSPRWTPSLAGWLLVAAILFLLLFILRLSAGIWLKSKLQE